MTRGGQVIDPNSGLWYDDTGNAIRRAPASAAAPGPLAPGPTATPPTLTTPGYTPPATGAPGTYQYGSPNDPTKYTSAQTLLGLQLNQGLSPQQAATAVNQYFNLGTGSQAKVYPGGPNGTEMVSIADPNGYFTNNGGTWGWNARSAAGPAPGGLTMGSLLTPFSETFTPPAQIPQPSAPVLNYPDFKAPTLEEAQANPGYQFALNEGERALQQSAAAQGTLNTGGTLKDVLNFGQAAAQQNYQNVFNNDLTAYNTNFGTAMAKLQPEELAYSTQSAFAQNQNNTNFSNAWAQYLQDYNAYRAQKLDTGNLLLGQEQLGLSAT